MFRNLRTGLGDIERAWTIRAEAPIRAAEIAQRVASGEIELSVPDTPENRAAVANQFIDQAIQSAQWLQAEQAQGIVYSNTPTGDAPADDYTWMPGQNPTVNQALAELAFTQAVLPAAPAFQAPEIPAMLAEQQVILQQQARNDAALREQIRQEQEQAAAVQRQYQEQLRAQQEAIAAQNRADNEAFARQQAEIRAANQAAQERYQAQLAADAKVAADARAALERQRAELLEEQRRNQQTTQQTTQQTLLDTLLNQTDPITGLPTTSPTYLTSGGGGYTESYPSKGIQDAGAPNDDLSYTGRAPVSPVMIGAIALGAFLLLRKN